MRPTALAYVLTTLFSVCVSITLALWPYDHHFNDFRSARRLWASYNVRANNLDICFVAIVYNVALSLLLGASLCFCRRKKTYFLLQLLQSITTPAFQASTLAICMNTKHNLECNDASELLPLRMLLDICRQSCSPSPLW